MSALFIRLYLDEDIDGLLATLLRARGYDVLTTPQSGRLAASDADQLAFAVAQRRTLLTHNRDDFERLSREEANAGRAHYGILIARRRDVYELARRILFLLDHVTADEIHDQVRYL